MAQDPQASCTFAGGAEHGNQRRTGGAAEHRTHGSNRQRKCEEREQRRALARSHPAQSGRTRRRSARRRTSGCERRPGERRASACATSRSVGMSRRLLTTSRAHAREPTAAPITSDSAVHRFDGHVGGAGGGHQPEEHEHEHLTEPQVAVRLRTARVEPAGSDGRGAHGEQPPRRRQRDRQAGRPPPHRTRPRRHVSPTTASARPLATSRVGPTRTSSVPRTPSL